MRSFVLVTIALLTMATVATAGVDMGLSGQRESLAPKEVTWCKETQGSTLSYTFNVYVNFQVGAQTPAGARSVEARIGASAANVAEIMSSDWTSGKNNSPGAKYNALQSKYDMEGIFGFYMWDISTWLPLTLLDGSINTVSGSGCNMPYSTAARAGGAAYPAIGIYVRPNYPGGVFLPADGILTMAILKIHLPDLPIGVYALNVCDAWYSDQASGTAMAITPGAPLIINVTPEPAAALLLIGALPFLRRRR